MNALQNKTLLLLRDVENLQTTVEQARRWGAVPIACPMIALRPPDDTAPLLEAARNLERFDWVIFPSANSVRFFWDHAEQENRFDAAKLRLAAMGPATRLALEERSWPVCFVPQQANAEAFLHEFSAQHPIQDQRFLLPLSSIARPTLTEGLRQRGGEVTAVTAYVNEPIKHLPQDVAERLHNQQIDWVVFTSSSTVNYFFEACARHAIDPATLRTASIGPKTSATLRALGMQPTVESGHHTMAGLLEAMDRK